jgi:hypothetical protein
MKNFIAILLLLLFGNSYSADYITVSGKISKLRNWSTHNGTLVYMPDMTSTSAVCPRRDSYILPKGHVHFKENYSLLLAARMSDKTVTLRFRVGDCADDFPRINHVDI